MRTTRCEATATGPTGYGGRQPSAALLRRENALKALISPQSLASDCLAPITRLIRYIERLLSHDYIEHGDPEQEVSAIGTAWIPTNTAIEEAAAKGIDLIITHERISMFRYKDTASGDKLYQKKKDLLDKHNIAVIRCHDTWDRMPIYGIPDAWAAFLGFDTEERSVESFYKLCKVDGMTAQEVADAILEKVKPLGQQALTIFGPLDKKVSRMAVGTGAITRVPSMVEMGADILLCTDDGTTSPNSGLYALDGNIPILVVSVHPKSHKINDINKIG